ncbi:MAG: cytochrome C oxidase subunit I, partial [Alphaproteobacteria bacterium]
ALSFDYPAAAFLMMGLNGMSAILAAVGGLAHIVVVVGSILFGERISDAPAPAAAEPPPATVASQHGSADAVAVPGTVVLVAVFFTTFVLYYFVNWKYVSQLWPLS